MLLFDILFVTVSWKKKYFKINNKNIAYIFIIFTHIIIN